MMKLTYYNGKYMASYEIDGTPFADMQNILESIVPNSWGDYAQVLHSGLDLIEDLDIRCVDGQWIVPVHNVSTWLFSFSLKNRSGNIYDLFRVFRRDFEQSLRVTWGMHVERLSLKECDVPYCGDYKYSAGDLYDIFRDYGISKVELSSYKPGDINTIQFLEDVTSCTSCGPRGHLLCEQIQYIEELPNGPAILDFIDEDLRLYLPIPGDYLDEYLDSLNASISLAASRFIGEL